MNQQNIRKLNQKITLFLILSGLYFFLGLESIYAYTQEEYRIYDEMMKTPMSVSEDEAHRKLGAKYGKSKAEIKATVEKVMNEIYFGKSSEQKAELKKRVEAVFYSKAEVQLLIVSGDFANVGYLESMSTWNNKDVKNKVTFRMSGYLKDIFAISGINKVRLTASYPTTDGTDMKVASVEVEREDFRLNKSLEKYESFWVKE